MTDTESEEMSKRGISILVSLAEITGDGELTEMTRSLTFPESNTMWSRVQNAFSERFRIKR
jgi:hypothetical protein